MASLNHLPIEILTNILFRLTYRDLTHASRVSRTLQAVAESLIYKSLSLSPNMLCRLIDTLLTPGRDVIGTYVFELTLGLNHSQFFLDSVGSEAEESFDDISECSDGASESLDDVSESLGNASESEGADSDDERPARNCSSPNELNTSLTNIECSDPHQISRANRRREYERFTAAVSGFGLDGGFTLVPFLLLLHLLPNLTSLTIAFPPDEFLFMEQLKSVPVSKLPVGLRSLRYFSSRQQGVSPLILCTLLQLPCISTINVHIFEAPNKNPGGDDYAAPVNSQWWTADEFLSAASGTSTVTTLKLHCNSLGPDALSHILSIPRALQILSYAFDPPSRVYLEPGRTIIPHQSSLRELTLECEVESTIGSPDLWPKLHSVTCFLSTLLGESDTLVRLEDMLPKGVKVLDILFDDDWSKREAVNIVLRLLKRRKLMLPRLETIGVRRDNEKGMMDWEKLKVACLKAGVKFLDDCVTLKWS